MTAINYARRRARGGRGLIPPNKTQWDNEHWALDVREDLELASTTPLPAIDGVFSRFLPHVTVLKHGDVPAAALFLQHFRDVGRRNWSGIAVQMVDGNVCVVYNDAHSERRTRITLMEEFFHLFLGHPSSAVRILPVDGNGRAYQREMESQAFGCAAAALVPYAGLKAFVDMRSSRSWIASQFRVSEQLVDFRLNVTRQFRRFSGRRKKSV